MTASITDHRFQADVACAHCRDRQPDHPVKLLVVRHTAVLETMPAETTIAVVRRMGNRSERRVGLASGPTTRPSRRGTTRNTLEPLPTPGLDDVLTFDCPECGRPRSFQLRMVLSKAGELARSNGFYVTVWI